MKIEVGRFYKTRAGQKARIYAIDGGGGHPIHGAIYYSDEEWIPEDWTTGGFCLYGADTSRPNDIVSEWSDVRNKN
jgi:hypothetical protein